MDIFFWIMVFGAISVIGGVLWWVFFFIMISSAARSAQQNLNQLLPNLEQQLRQANRAGSGHMNAGQQAQIMQMLMQAQNQMHQLDGIHRMRYENKVGDLMGMAANAGIDWRPGDY